MKADIHPKLNVVKVHCGCGNEFQTLSTATEIRLELCGACHPFYTGKKRALAVDGRVQKFEAKYKNVGSTPIPNKPKAKPKAKAPAKPAAKAPAKAPAKAAKQQ